MGTIGVRVTGLGKRYRLGAHLATSFREHLALKAQRAARLLRGERRPPPAELFWALKDVSFEVGQGEVVGIIGHNGAGKSTLLKILSRITEPTCGTAELTGRIASLLEVGSGFHPELTGRENIFLNGAILGMSQAEIRRKFDEIVAFAEVERFVDTAVKHYSSGMYLRLAFSVAAHLESEILVIDEVLAVGDAAFQKRCLGKMEERAHQGRTILFVSHNLAAVNQLCQRAILLSKGTVVADGPSFEVVSHYLSATEFSPYERAWEQASAAPGTHGVHLMAAQVRQGDSATGVIDINKPLCLRFDLTVDRDVENLVASIVLVDVQGAPLFSSCDWRPNQLRAGRHRFEVEVPRQTLAEGRVSVCFQAFFFDPHVMCIHDESLLVFEAVDSQDPDSVRGPYKGSWAGAVRLRLNWRSPEFLGPAEIEPDQVPVIAR